MTLENFLELFSTPSFWPHNAIFEVRIKPSCDYTFTAGPNLMCPSSWASNSDNFLFFWILYCSSRTQVIAVWRSVNIWWNFSHTGADVDYDDLWPTSNQSKANSHHHIINTAMMMSMMMTMTLMIIIIIIIIIITIIIISVIIIIATNVMVLLPFTLNCMWA